MACWVAPSVAAEYWNVPVDQILDQIRCGTIPSKVMEGFTVINISPEIPEPPSRQEIEALTHGLDEEVMAAESTPNRAEAILADLEQAALRDSGDWRSGRMRAASIRRPPGRHRR